MQPRCPSPVINLARAIRRDVVAPSDPRDPSTGPFVRGAALGFGLEVGPAVLRIVLGQVLAKRRSLDSLRRALRALVTAVYVDDPGNATDAAGSMAWDRVRSLSSSA